MNPDKICTVKPYSFLVIDATIASEKPLRFRKNLLERIWKLIMTIVGKIRDYQPSSFLTKDWYEDNQIKNDQNCKIS